MNSLNVNSNDVNTKDSEGYTLLHRAVEKNDHEKVKMLIDNGADVNAEAEEGGSTALYWAVYKPTTQILVTLLGSGADVNSKDNNGATPLHFASINSPESAEILLKNGADVNAKDAEGYTPLRLAKEKNASRTYKVLRKYKRKKRGLWW